MLGINCNIQNIQHLWEGAKKETMTVFESMYLENLNNEMVGFVNITARGMLDHIFLSYGSIMDMELEKNFENMCKACDFKKPVEKLFKQIHDCVDFEEAGDIKIGKAQKLTTAYTKIPTNGIFNSDWHRWDEKLEVDKTWGNPKMNFSESYRQHMRIHGETAAASGYAKTAISQPE